MPARRKKSGPKAAQRLEAAAMSALPPKADVACAVRKRSWQRPAKKAQALKQVRDKNEQDAAGGKKQKFGSHKSSHGRGPLNALHGRALAG
jgi:hypothetical protein